MQRDTMSKGAEAEMVFKASDLSQRGLEPDNTAKALQD